VSLCVKYKMCVFVCVCVCVSACAHMLTYPPLTHAHRGVSIRGVCECMITSVSCDLSFRTHAPPPTQTFTGSCNENGSQMLMRTKAILPSYERRWRGRPLSGGPCVRHGAPADHLDWGGVGGWGRVSWLKGILCRVA